MNEKELIIRLKHGDKEAFSALYHVYWAKVYNFSKLYITSEAEIEEVVQEVFVKVWENRESIKENENFKGFLFIITRNTIFTNSRKSLNETYYKLSVINAAEEACDNLEDEIAAKDLQEFINTLLNDLTKRQREIFLFSRNEHMTYKEIAEKLGITEKTVERHINDALRYLKKNIKLFSIFLSI